MVIKYEGLMQHYYLRFSLFFQWQPAAFDISDLFLDTPSIRNAHLKLKNCGFFILQRRMFGDDILGALNIQMIKVARSVGATSKFTGSGGAVVAFCPDGPSQLKLLENECQKAGFRTEPIKVAPSTLNEDDLRTLSKHKN